MKTLFTIYAFRFTALLLFTIYAFRFTALLLFTIYAFRFTAFAAFKDTGWGTRPIGIGGAFTAVSDDASAALWNPAGLTQLKRTESNFMYAKLYTGLKTVDLNLNYASFVYPIEGIGAFGVSWANFISAKQYQEDTYILSYAKKINDFIPRLIPILSIGINLKYLNHKYVLDERTVNDPVFSEKNSQDAMTEDAGILFKFSDTGGLRFGVSAKNITQPDVGLKTKDIVPLEMKYGFAEELENLWVMENIIFAFDVTSRDKDLNIHTGIETWFMERTFGVRIGGNYQEITAGLSYNNYWFFRRLGFQFDYAFIWPLHIEESLGSHRASLTVRFGALRGVTKSAEVKPSKQEVTSE